MRRRKPAAERRAEIVATASAIALSEGLERITLRAVADRLGVRPGLITHYFPAVDQLVAEAFANTASAERNTLFPESGTPLERLRRFTRQLQAWDSIALARLWLNARHLARFQPLLAAALETQERLDREQLEKLIAQGIATGDFNDVDPTAAAVRILTAVDGVGAYANNPVVYDVPAFTGFISEVAEWALGLERGVLSVVSAAGAAQA